MERCFDGWGCQGLVQCSKLVLARGVLLGCLGVDVWARSAGVAFVWLL